MKTTPITPQDIAGSVIAVPPLARSGPDFSVNRDENSKLIRHIEGGGVTTLLYGGNANFYHIALSEYEGTLGLLEALAGRETWVIPSVGPAYGLMMDQAKILARTSYPTAMVLPLLFPAKSSGVATGIRKFVEAMGRPAMVYLKDEGYMKPGDVKKLCDDGLVSVIKYAIVRPDTAKDAYLTELVDLVDRKLIVSGIGEQPAIIHTRDFGLGGFTSGCVCVAPGRSRQMMETMRQNDWAGADAIRQRFEELEDLRNAHGPIPVLHEAVRLAEIADTGPMLPLMSNLDAALWPAVEAAAKQLSVYEAELA